METFVDLTVEEASRSEDSSSSADSAEATGNEKQSHCCSSEESSSASSSSFSSLTLQKTHLGSSDARKLEKEGSSLPETEMMKERFAKLLLGEDMSGCGNGVSTALAISNAITNLCATIFGQVWRLEPLPIEKKKMWTREMDWFLSVSDHIVDMIPTCQTFPDGTKLEIMTCRPRSDLYANLPALRKLDNMLLEVLEGFRDTEFWYVEQGIVACESARQQLQRQEDKWWLPVPRVPAGGLLQDTRKQLQHTRECTSQILKAAMAINTTTLADMAVPSAYLQNLPKNGRASLGENVYRYITSDHFSAECLLDCLDLSSEHQAVETANRVEASIYLWRQNTSRSASRSSWGVVKELMVDVDKRQLLADRAECLLLCLKQRFPGLPQTTLDITKIQYNKDVGKSILESYSRVLESLAFNIIARIDHLLCVDDFTKHSDRFVSSPFKSTPVAFSAASTPPFVGGGGVLVTRGFGMKKDYAV